MSTSRLAPFASILVCSLLVPVGPAAQAAPEPSAELKPYDQLVGHWQGKGVAAVPGMGDVPWTADIAGEWVLDGFFLRTRGEIAVGAPTPMQVLGIYGYDAALGRHVGFGAGNEGEAHLHEVVWTDAKTMVASSGGVHDGQPFVTRSIWRFGDDRYDYVMERADGTGPWDVQVEGTFTKVEKAPEWSDDAAFIAAPPVGREMRRLHATTGSFATKGWMILPDMPKLELEGTETRSARYGGHLLESNATGTVAGMPVWKGIYFMAWNANTRCFDQFGFSNFGEVSKGEMRWVDDRVLLMTASTLSMGQPMLGRSILKIGDDGSMVASSHSIRGTEEPVHSFWMELLADH